MKQIHWKTYVPWVLLAEAVGAIAGWLTRSGTALYNSTAVKPPLSPPAVVFPIAWVILYALMGLGAARIRQTPPSQGRSTGLLLFFIQLAFNFIWSILFFNLRTYGLAFVWLVVLWLLILGMTRAFGKMDLAAARMQWPYLLWVAFAGYLNLGVWILN